MGLHFQILVRSSAPQRRQIFIRSTGEEKNVFTSLTVGRGRKRKLVRDVTGHPQPLSLPTTSSQHIHTTCTTTTASSLRSQSIDGKARVEKPPPIDRRRLTNDPHLRQEVATVTGDHFRVLHPQAVAVLMWREAAFGTAVLQTAELVAPPQERRLPGRGWRGDAQEEVELKMAMTARRAAWKRQKAGTKDSQLKRDVRRKNTHVQRVCDAAYARFLENAPKV